MIFLWSSSFQLHHIVTHRVAGQPILRLETPSDFVVTAEANANATTGSSKSATLHPWEGQEQGWGLLQDRGRGRISGANAAADIIVSAEANSSFGDVAFKCIRIHGITPVRGGTLTLVVSNTTYTSSGIWREIRKDIRKPNMYFRSKELCQLATNQSVRSLPEETPSQFLAISKKQKIGAAERIFIFRCLPFECFLSCSVAEEATNMRAMRCFSTILVLARLNRGSTNCLLLLASQLLAN